MHTSFNSKMVRLLADSTVYRNRAWDVSIPKWCDCWQAAHRCNMEGLDSFNSKMVRLLACEFVKLAVARHCFNSKMVRLLVNFWTG